MRDNDDKYKKKVFFLHLRLKSKHLIFFSLTTNTKYFTYCQSLCLQSIDKCFFVYAKCSDESSASR